MLKKERIVYFDLLRILATFAVVVIHVSAKGMYNVDVHNVDWDINNIFDSLSRWSVPIFCMISGALFLDVDNKISTKSLYTKNILRICTAFLFWSFGYAIASAFVKSNWSIIEIVKDTITGHYHMWFLFMIIGFYIAVPILRKITEDKSTAKYFIIVSLFATFLIPQILSFDVFSKGSKIVNEFYFEITLGYIPYFVMGHYIHKYGVSKKLQKIIYILGALSFIITTVATSVFSKKYGEPYEGFYEYLTVNVLFESLAVFLFGKYILSKIKFSDKAFNIIHTLSRDTFGIYLSHVLFIEILLKLVLSKTVFTPLLSVPVISLTVFVLSWVLSHMLNCIPIVKKYIV